MLPVILVEGNTLPEAWEKSIVETWRRGVIIDTEYGQRSKDAVMLMVVRKPMAEPRIHRAGLTVGRMTDLETYVKEILDGVNDWRIGRDWDYTYHERLFSYRLDGNAVDQISYVVNKLSETPYTRRAQAITWKPWSDPHTDSPPCLQRLWFRIVDGRLVMHAMWRSRDAFKAAFMNMYALTLLQERVARQISEKTGVKIEVGEYVDFSNSYHIYESDWGRAAGFAALISKRSWESRTWTTEQYRKMCSKLAIR